MNADFAILGLQDLGGWTLAQATSLPPLPSPSPAVTPPPTAQTTVGGGSVALSGRPSFWTDPAGNLAGWFAERWESLRPWLRRYGVNLVLVAGAVALVVVFVASSGTGQEITRRVVSARRGAIVDAVAGEFGG